MAERLANKSFFSDLKGLKRLWPYLRTQKKLIVIASLLIPAISLLEMNVPIVIKKIIDNGINQKNWHYLMIGALTYLALVTFQYLFRASQSISAAVAVHRMIRDLRNVLLAHVMKLSCRFHDRTMSGKLVTRATSDFDSLSESLNTGVLTAIIDFAVLFGSLVGLFYLNWKLAIASILALPVLGTVVSLFSRALKRTMLKARANLADLNSFTQECLYGSSTIKLLTAQKEVKTHFDLLNENYRKAQMKSVTLDANLFSIIDGLTSITVGFVLYLALNGLAKDSEITAGLMVAFVIYIQQMFEPVKQLSSKIAMLQGAFTSIDRIFGILEQNDFIEGDCDLKEIKGSLEFKNVSFKYREDQKKPTLDQLTFKLSAGESLAIVGPTGSGKSTIVKLITKLYDAYSGSILIDGVEISSVKSDDIRRNLAIVPQDIVIFDGSVSYNISLGLPGINQDDIIRASKLVGADDFIQRLPGGYQFNLKEQGSNLSVGQRQLIAFARALAKKPAMIVLDEATSSVDPESEKLIQNGVDSILTGQTVIVIAHRLATIQKCQNIMLIEDGRKIEYGSHAELQLMRGSYSKLFSAAIPQQVF